MSDLWTNAVIEIRIPLEVDPYTDAYVKQEAVGEVFDLIDFPENATVSGYWEDVRDGETEATAEDSLTPPRKDA